MYKGKDMKVQLTVALPLYNSYNIAWIALESLCNQQDIFFDWELIICEEKTPLSIDYLDLYRERLERAGCVKITHIPLDEHIDLMTKWGVIASHISDTSEVFLLQAADCYSYSMRLHNTFMAIGRKDYDWYDNTKGYFYSMLSDEVFLYNFNSLTNLSMAFHTRNLRHITFDRKERGIDGYIFNQIFEGNPDMKVFRDNSLYPDGIDTHGYNHISKQRQQFFITKPHIFSKSTLTIRDTGIPLHVRMGLSMCGGLYAMNRDKNTFTTATVCIAAYDCADYIEECLNSIPADTKVILGIDGCKPTLDKVMAIKENYKNLKVIYFPENRGTYITFNTIIKHVPDNSLVITFGADDVMGDGLVAELIENQPCCSRYPGVMCFSKTLFETLGGYRDWRISADSDFLKRSRMVTAIKVLPQNFMYRTHDKQVTAQPQTKYSSKLRQYYTEVINNNKDIYVEPVYHLDREYI